MLLSSVQGCIYSEQQKTVPDDLRTASYYRALPCIPGNKKPALRRVHILLAGGLGFEPRLEASEATVLPLDDPPN